MLASGGSGRRNGMAESAAQEQHSQSANGLSQSAAENRADALIAAYIEPHAGKPGIAEYRLHVEENGYPVWAIVAYMTITSDNTEQIAREYRISSDAVEAVHAFYSRHQEAIDARLAANRAY
jgi:uncharacterized protein (DUF433 family)